MAVKVDKQDVTVIQDGHSVQAEDELGYDSYVIFLKNFPLNGSGPLPEHTEILREWVAPYFKHAGSVCEIYAMSDRSGDKKTNYKVSAERLKSVQGALVGLGVPPQKVYHQYAKAIGEDFADYKKIKNGEKNPEHRIVVIGLSPGPIGIPTRFFQGAFTREIISFGRLHQQTP